MGMTERKREEQGSQTESDIWHCDIFSFQISKVLNKLLLFDQYTIGYIKAE